MDGWMDGWMDRWVAFELRSVRGRRGRQRCCYCCLRGWWLTPHPRRRRGFGLREGERERRRQGSTELDGMHCAALHCIKSRRPLDCEFDNASKACLTFKAFALFFCFEYALDRNDGEQGRGKASQPASQLLTDPPTPDVQPRGDCCRIASSALTLFFVAQHSRRVTSEGCSIVRERRTLFFKNASA